MTVQLFWYRKKVIQIPDIVNKNKHKEVNNNCLDEFISSLFLIS